MIYLRFASPHWDPEARRMEFRHVADVWVDGHDVHVEGDASVFSTDIPVVEPGTGERLTFDASPERWALALPTAYRSGDLEVTAFEASVAAPAVPVHA